MTDGLDWLHEESAARAEAGLHRELRRRTAPNSPASAVSAAIDLASNDYLGLALDPRIRQGAAEAALTWGGGASASRLVTGNLAIHEECESALAELTGAPAALLFSSGYLANLAAVTSVVRPGATIIADSDNHASLIDAARLAARPRRPAGANSGAQPGAGPDAAATSPQTRIVVAGHRDPVAVKAALAEHSARSEAPAVIVTDAVFSVGGTIAPLAELAALADEYGAVLVVDEAHALGVVGERGAGALADAGVPIGPAANGGGPAVVATGTLSKSFGAQGGIVLGSQALRAHLIDTARSFIFDTGLAPASAGAALAALATLRSDPALAERTRLRARSLHRALRDALVDESGRPIAFGVEMGPAPDAALVSVIMPGPQQAVRAAELIRDDGIWVGCFRPPSVADGLSRLRLTARAVLTDDQLARVAASVRAAVVRSAAEAAP